MQTSYDIRRVRLVDASQNIAPTSRSWTASNMFSTSFNGLSARSCFRKFQNVFGRIAVSVVMLTAVLAVELADIQRHFFVNVAAGRTPFAGRKEAIRNTNLLPIPHSLVFQHFPELTEAGATDVFGQRPQFDHVPRGQILNGQHVETTHQIRCELVETVLPAVGNFGVNFCDLELLQLPSVAAFDATGKDSLHPRQPDGILSRMARIRNGSPVIQSCQPVNSQVDPDLPTRLWERDFVRFIQTKAHEISPRTVLCYRDCAWLARELAAPFNAEATDFGNCKIAIRGVPLESVDCVFSGLLAVLGTEAWILGTLGEEIGESCLHVPQRLLLRDAGRLAQPCKLGIVAMLCPFAGTCHVIDGLPVFETVSAKFQCKIVSVSSTSKLPRKLPLLALCRVKPECLS